MKFIIACVALLVSFSLYAESHGGDRGHGVRDGGHFFYRPPVCRSPFFYGGAVISGPVYGSRVQYIQREEVVMVEAAREELRYVQPVYETRIDAQGRPYTIIVREGYYEKIFIPARYERRIVTVPVAAPVVVEPSFSFGLFFGR